MKRSYRLLLLMVVIVLLGACSNNNNDEDKEAVDEAVSVSTAQVVQEDVVVSRAILAGLV